MNWEYMWSIDDRICARDEGWRLNNHPNKDVVVIIESTGENRMFDDDEDALIYVRNMAEKGSNLHLKAMSIIGEEVEAFKGVAVEPPLGLTPKSIWMKLRLKDIKEAAKRYESVGKEIPKEWIEEAGELALKLEDWG